MSAATSQETSAVIQLGLHSLLPRAAVGWVQPVCGAIQRSQDSQRVRQRGRCRAQYLCETVFPRSTLSSACRYQLEHFQDRWGKSHRSRPRLVLFRRQPFARFARVQGDRHESTGRDCCRLGPSRWLCERTRRRARQSSVRMVRRAAGRRRELLAEPRTSRRLLCQLCHPLVQIPRLRNKGTKVDSVEVAEGLRIDRGSGHRRNPLSWTARSNSTRCARRPRLPR